MCPHLFLDRGILVASKSSDFGSSCLGLPSSPELLRMWNVTSQLSAAGLSAGDGPWAPPHLEPQAGLFLVAPRYPGAGSSLALSGLGAGWRFRFLRRLAGPGLGESELAPRAAGAH